MKKQKTTSFLKEHIYYVAVVIGIIALATTVVIYNMRASKEQTPNGQLVDLNETNSQEYVAQESEGTEESQAVINNEIASTTEVITESTTEVKTKEDTESTTKTTEETLSFTKESKLSWPVVGNVIMPYSMNTTVYFETLDQYKCNPAIFIQATEDTTVGAACKGKILEITDDGQLGKKITMDVGDGYQLVYAQLKDVTVHIGDVVEKNAIIAKIAKPTQFFTVEGPHLYFALSKKGEAVNPMTFLN